MARFQVYDRTNFRYYEVTPTGPSWSFFKIKGTKFNTREEAEAIIKLCSVYSGNDFHILEIKDVKKGQPHDHV